MTINIDNYFYFIINNIYCGNFNLKNIFNLHISDLILNLQIFKNIYLVRDLNFIPNNILPFYTDSLYLNIINNNLGYFSYTKNTNNFNSYNFIYIYIFKIFLKLNIIFFILYTIFFLTNFESYLKQIKTINLLVKLFTLNSTEKEVGPVDDYFFFVILFISTISMFIFTSILLVLTQIKIFI